jgi:hypothetical protein
MMCWIDRMSDIGCLIFSLNLLLLFMTRKELQERTKKFHVDVIKLCEKFPKMQQALKPLNN